MFRRPRPQSEPDPRPTSTVPSAEPADATRVLTDLLARPTAEGILEGALTHGLTLLGGGPETQTQGYALLRRGQQDRVAVVCGAPRALVGLTLSGPWSDKRARVVTGSAALYEANSPEVQAQLDACGMRDVALSLVVPLTDRGRTLGALVFDRKGPEAITPAQQEAVARWAVAVAPLLGLIDARDDWRGAARQLTVGLVEAVESREFDSLGHGQAVAETAVRLGRAVGLVERELEELWYAAVLHDLGKLHGEAGHAQVGANFLHGVSHLAEAQRAIRHHHERWDGQGDPGGLGGEDIPLYARILAVANAYVRLGDMERLKSQAGKGLDPRLVGLFEKLPPQ